MMFEFAPGARLSAAAILGAFAAAAAIVASASITRELALLLVTLAFVVLASAVFAGVRRGVAAGTCLLTIGAVLEIIASPQPATLQTWVLGLMIYAQAEIAWCAIDRRDGSTFDESAVKLWWASRLSVLTASTTVVAVASVVNQGPTRTLPVQGLTITLVIAAVAALRRWGPSRSAAGITS